MMITQVPFSTGNVAYAVNVTMEDMLAEYKDRRLIFITDQNVYALYKERLSNFECIIIEPGEQFKNQATVDNIIIELIKRQADKKTILVGIGGGVVTDITGYAAAIFKRGLQHVLIPTTLLAMVDAAIGGKNGVDVGTYKNMVGTIHQPLSVIFDVSFLQTLPDAEWTNGFAEIIKHACIKDAELFAFLEANDMAFFQKNINAAAALIKQNIEIKTKVVLEDEFETGNRKLLNFGHSFGHAIENAYQLSHGNAISIGMVMAATISEEINNFNSVEKERIIKLLRQYGLPVKHATDHELIWDILLADKKRENNAISFILLNSIGNAVITPIPLPRLKDIMNQCL